MPVINADRSTKHIEHESVRAATEVVYRKRRTIPARGNERGVLPKGTPYIPGMRAVGSIAFASIYDQPQFAAAGRPDPAPIEFFLERKLPEGMWDPKKQKYVDLWVTDRSWGKPGAGLSLAAARGIAKNSNGFYRVVVRDAWGRYSPE